LKGVEKVNIVQGVKAGALAVARVDTAISKNALSLLTGRQRGSRIHLEVSLQPAAFMLAAS
jgi:hypothetical protein